MSCSLMANVFSISLRNQRKTFLRPAYQTPNQQNITARWRHMANITISFGNHKLFLRCCTTRL